MKLSDMISKMIETYEDVEIDSIEFSFNLDTEMNVKNGGTTKVKMCIGPKNVD